MNAAVEDDGRMVAEGSMISTLNRSEIEQQITTARRFPRSVKRFRDEATQMVTLSESIAEQCIYALPRDGKTIEGPSARFAEIVASAWGNCRAGSRVVDDTGEFVTAQGVFHDLERNVAITYEVQRRITDKQGRRYKADMIGVTANAACSIALRNAILKGVPKAFWEDMYAAARSVIMGDIKTLANRRAAAVAAFAKFGVLPEQIVAKLGVAGVEDISLENLVTLKGLLTAIRDGDTTAEDAFGAAPSSKANAQQPAALPPIAEAEFDKSLAKWLAAIESGQKTADEIIAMAGSKYTLTEVQQAAIRGTPKANEPKQTDPIEGEVVPAAEAQS